MLLKEINEIIQRQDDGTEEGKLKARLCGMVFLIRKLPREVGADNGVRANAEMLSDLLVTDLADGSKSLRVKIPQLLDEFVDKGTLIKVDNEYSLQTRESSEWEQEFRNRRDKLINDPTRMNNLRGQYLNGAVQEAIGTLKLTHGKCNEPRKLSLYFGSEIPAATLNDITVWVRDGWSTEESSVMADARAAGQDSPVISVFNPRAESDAMRKAIAEETAAKRGP